MGATRIGANRIGANRIGANRIGANRMGASPIPTNRAKLWQAYYYEPIVRNDRELNAIRQYIIDNPIHWRMDRDNLENLRKLPPPERILARNG